ncbi:MAG TPA: DUF4134 domain-containing protein [Mucilaginibacter sp.]|jgi:hypothetical protein|nr:DUF4134 domain-containing protein [Mucilaginibacter sp.]
MKLFINSIHHYFKSWINAYRSLSGEKKRIALTKTLMFMCAMLTINYCFGQDGNSGINSATTQVKSYFDSGCNLMYAIGAVVGIIGAIKVFNKWNAGEPDTNKVAAAWFGSCVFLVVVATVLKSFFGL